MKAADASYGNRDIRIIETPKPSPRNGEVLVKVLFSAVEDGENQVLSDSWVGKFLHRKTSPLIFGWNIEGVVEEIGSGVRFQTGDHIWGHLDFSPFQNQGAYSEYVIMRAGAISKIPAGIDEGMAASFATIGLTALQALRDYGGLKPGMSLLVIGAGGGIGGVAVSIGKKLGAKVIGVCSTKDIEKVKHRGADDIIDRSVEGFLKSESRFDVILDTPSKYSFGLCSNLLNESGVYVDLHPWTLLPGFFQSLFSSKKCRFAQVQSKQDDLGLLGEWIESGMEIPISIEHEFPISKLGLALQQRLNPSRSGAIVVRIHNGW